jgi:hypothetical protein
MASAFALFAVRLASKSARSPACASTIARRAYTAPSASIFAPALALKQKSQDLAPKNHSGHGLAIKIDAGELPRATPGEKDVFVHWKGAEWSRL